MLRKLPKRRNVAKSKSDSEIATSTTSGKERGENEEAVAEAEATEEAIVIPIGVRHEIQDLHLPDAEAHRLASVVFHHLVRLIHTSHLAEVVAGQMTGDAGHLLLKGRLAIRDPDLRLHHVEDTKTAILQDHAVDLLQADLELLHAGIMAEIGIREFGDVVMIEQDPIHLQIPLAHVRPDEAEMDALLPRHLVALHPLQDPELIVQDGIHRLERALVQ